MTLGDELRDLARKRQESDQQASAMRKDEEKAALVAFNAVVTQASVSIAGETLATALTRIKEQASRGKTNVKLSLRELGLRDNSREDFRAAEEKAKQYIAQLPYESKRTYEAGYFRNTLAKAVMHETANLLRSDAFGFTSVEENIERKTSYIDADEITVKL